MRSNYSLFVINNMNKTTFKSEFSDWTSFLITADQPQLSFHS